MRFWTLRTPFCWVTILLRGDRESVTEGHNSEIEKGERERSQVEDKLIVTFRGFFNFWGNFPTKRRRTPAQAKPNLLSYLQQMFLIIYNGILYPPVLNKL